MLSLRAAVVTLSALSLATVAATAPDSNRAPSSAQRPLVRRRVPPAGEWRQRRRFFVRRDARRLQPYRQLAFRRKPSRSASRRSAIPTPVQSAKVAELPFATYRQPFADPTEGGLSRIAKDGVALAGLLVSGNRLYGTGFIYYDALNAQAVSHYSRSLNLSEPSFKGMYAVGEAGKTGFVSGYLAAVPPEWQALLGGPAMTGQCCLPIISRTSWGPAAFAWDPAKLGTVTPLPATPIVFYNGDHPDPRPMGRLECDLWRGDADRRRRDHRRHAHRALCRPQWFGSVLLRQWHERPEAGRPSRIRRRALLLRSGELGQR